MLDADATLFDEPATLAARATDPDTSRAAASDAYASGRASRDRRRVLEALVCAGADGLTDFELADRLCGQQTSLGVRRHELVLLDPPFAEKVAGVKRPSPSGAAAQVWRATHAGRCWCATGRAVPRPAEEQTS